MTPNDYQEVLHLLGVDHSKLVFTHNGPSATAHGRAQGAVEEIFA